MNKVRAANYKSRLNELVERKYLFLSNNHIENEIN